MALGLGKRADDVQVWSPSFPLHAPALIPLCLTKVWLSPTLTLSSLIIWYCGLTALFLLLLARAALACLPTAFSVALKPLFPFQQAQYVQVFRLKPAPFCTLFVGLGNTNKLSTSFFFSSYLTLVLSPPLCPLLRLSFYPNLCGRSDRNCFLSPALSGYNGSPDTCFSRGKTRLMSWSKQGALLAPSAIPCSLSPLISRINVCLFLDLKRTVS